MPREADLTAAQSPGKMLPFSAVAKSRKEQKLRKAFFAVSGLVFPSELMACRRGQS